MNRRTDARTYRNRARLICRPVVGGLGTIGWMIWSIHSFGPFHLQFGNVSVPLGVVGLVMALLTLFCTWTNLFFLYVYRYDGTVLHMIDPLLRRKWSVNMFSIVAVRDFRNDGKQAPLDCRKGHVLIDANGNSIILMEDIPIWPDLAKHIDGVVRGECSKLSAVISLYRGK
jgi:hypothetical protein